MNNSAVEKNTKELPSEFGIVNEDWPLLNEISQNQNKFHINKKKNNFNIAKNTKDIAQASLLEDEDVSLLAQQDERSFEEVFVQKYDSINETQVNHLNSSQGDTGITKPTELTQVKDDSFTVPVVQAKVDKSEAKSLKQEIIDKNPLLKLVAIGLTKQYVKKTNSVLNPVKFVADNYKNVLIAVLHLGAPALMAWFLLTKVEFISSQLIGVSNFMLAIYSIIFYFASLFMWVTGQVLISGIMSMIKNTLVSVAKDAQHQKD